MRDVQAGVKVSAFNSSRRKEFLDECTLLLSLVLAAKSVVTYGRMPMDDMDDSLMFMQWAVSTLQHEEDQGGADENRAGFACLQALPELPEAHKRQSSGADTRRCGGLISPSPDAAMQQGSNSTLTSFPASGSMSSTGATYTHSMSWNFNAAQPSSVGGGTQAARAPLRSGVSQPTRRAVARKVAACAQGHIMAERKRREKTNQRFIELSALIPGLKKMDKGTILSNATSYVKELQEKVKSLEAAGGSHRSVETVVLVKEGSPLFYSADRTAASSQLLPEIEAKLSGNKVMLRIHCEINGKGLVARVLAELEEFHLRVVHNNVMPFTQSTVIITTMAKASSHEQIYDSTHSDSKFGCKTTTRTLKRG
ncbi:transcription factor bHLH19 [Triticum aestivum]|uniref:transcription factor bHLH19 n=1 Tax=Triticum aestivum TaxID=4565 RepID=UPI001D01013F|nr:transcription factor bHLH19-like [Triticum aestivum]